MGAESRNEDVYQFMMRGFSNEEVNSLAPEFMKEIADGQDKRRNFIKNSILTKTI